MKKIITSLALIVLALSANAVTFTVDGICYQTASGGVNVIKESSGYENYENLVDAVIPSVVSYNGHNYQVVRISDQAFRYAENLKSIEIPNTVKMIGASAFYSCSSLTSITIPNSVTSIGNSAITTCANLRSVKISKSVKSIGTNNLKGCPQLEEIWVDPENTVFDSRDNCNALIKTSTNELLMGCNTSFIPASVESIADKAFYNCDRLKTITIPTSVTSIGYQAFSGCDSLASVTIDGLLSYFGARAFEFCSSLHDVQLSEGIETISLSCFEYCTSLKSINIPESVNVIDSCAFLYCSKLESVNLGANIQRIGARAFMNCLSLNSIHSYIQIPQNVTCGNRVFEGVDKSLCMLFVPEGTVSLYQARSPWKDFINIVENSYVPLVREGVVWEYVGESDDPLPKHSLYTLEFNGTTTIDGKVYHKIYRTDYDKQGNAQNPYFVAFVREENKVVTVYNYTYDEDEYFYYTYWWMVPKTLYDFSKPMFLPDEAYIIFGDDGPIDYNTNYYPSSSIEVEVGETTRKGYYIDHGNDDESFKTIEGIGVDCGFGDLLVPYRTYYTGFNPMASLAAVYENGELVYKGRAYDKAQRLKYPVEGDVNDDGVVTSADITALYNYLLDSDYQYYETSDVDGDGEVTSADITAVYNILLGE
ncbi:MAG: leucine-rich repeat protein [Muribaculaceae bacterium]|nr:leucine-rich repeat protein [Muribaculaceae bacterium]